MAYRRKRKTYILEWAEGPFAGLEVKVGSLPIGRFMDLAPYVDADITPEAVAAFMPALQEMADAIISWNMEDEDEAGNVTPVPATLDGLLTLAPEEMSAILHAWISAGTSVSAPLGQPSTIGSPVVDSDSTEEWLANLPNSSEPV